MLDSIRAMLFFLKDFAYDTGEQKAADFHQHIDALGEKYDEELPAEVAQEALSSEKEYILHFIAEQKSYLTEREAEFTNIIDMLRTGLTEMLGSNQQYNSTLYERNMRMEQITRLDDIRRMKVALASEVAQVRKVIQEKQEKDTEQMDALAREVDLLRNSLEEVKDASMLDGLTGAYNRLAFDTQLNRLIERNNIVATPFALLMCDLDDFKKINDTYGHQVGDRVLMCFVREAKAMFRKEDIIARYGGEEFAIILPGINLRQAYDRAIGLCKLLTSKQYLADEQSCDTMIRFSVSIGISAVRPHDTADDLVTRADRALYQSKRNGKSRATIEESGNFFRRIVDRTPVAP